METVAAKRKHIDKGTVLDTHRGTFQFGISDFSIILGLLFDWKVEFLKSEKEA